MTEPEHLRLQVQCMADGCDSCAELQWDEYGYWNAWEGDPDPDCFTPPSIYFDKSFVLPDGWHVSYGGKTVLCAQHSAGN